MRREYKGFYIEEGPRMFGSGRASKSYTIYHVVTGALAGTLPTIRAAKDEIDSIHNDVRVYARYAGCHPTNLTLKRGRWVYGYSDAGYAYKP